MEDKINLIEKYLMNELSVWEQVKFEEELRSNPELMREFQLRRNINVAILEDKEVTDLRNMLDDVMNDEPVVKKTSRNLCFYSAVAAMIILCLVVGDKIFFSNQTFSSKEAYEQYYSVYPPVIGFRSPADQSGIESSLYDGFYKYNENNFEQAANYFKQVVEKDSSNYMGQFYLAVCKIETNNLNEAEKYLVGLVSENNHIFWEQSHWYLAMLYLKGKKTDQARSVLNKMVQENMTRKSQANHILKSLE